jgi:hypothetical protein
MTRIREWLVEWNATAYSWPVNNVQVILSVVLVVVTDTP